ncbi:hypothetical protein [Erythrobacter aureus]|uniref:Uncharacterized protein n=1 Tax=Erythrobacter aureus TaxID=2182384 RepID=A0A345YIT9_9SPHN|nr:hypothetical protein [Erythrobacter aureus]AXK43841.1 hypothetical protein DVR09_15410 [Erythrobacter aureus]
MNYIDSDARIAGTLSLTHNPLLFENQEQLDEYKASLIGRSHEWQGRTRPIPHQKLWDEDPERFPCLMIPVAEKHNPDGADWIMNLFLYDPEIIEENS